MRLGAASLRLVPQDAGSDQGDSREDFTGTLLERIGGLFEGPSPLGFQDDRRRRLRSPSNTGMQVTSRYSVNHVPLRKTEL